MASSFTKFPAQTFINGDWCSAADGRTFEVIAFISLLPDSINFSIICDHFLKVYNPADNKLLGSVPDCNVADVNVAVEAAHSAFKVWSGYTADVSKLNYYCIFNEVFLCNKLNFFAAKK